MINHARTLLMNVDGSGYSGTLGDEYVPTAYTSLALPTYLDKLRVYLFGTHPDRAFLNYRTQQLMALLHSTPLVEFITDLDSRITYDTDNPDMFSDDNYELTDSANMFFGNKLGAPDATGLSFHRWKITGFADGQLRVTRQSPVPGVEEHDYVSMAGLSEVLPLLGSTANFRFRDGEEHTIPELCTLTSAQLELLTAEELHVMALDCWLGSITTARYVEGYARPERDLGVIAASLRGAGTPYTVSLFGLGTPTASTEPFKTFRNLWNGHPEIAYQLGGLLLAMIYRTEERRVNNG